MPSSAREQCLQRAEACDRLAVETMDAHVRETMQFLAGAPWPQRPSLPMRRAPMATAAEFRDEARHMRVLALEIVTDAVVQAELQALIDELEARALEADSAR